MLKGGTQNELPSFSNKKIIVIRLSVVRSAVLCYLNRWSVQDSFNKENMLTDANNYWPHYKSSRLISNETCQERTWTLKIKKKTNNYLYISFFLTLTNKPTCLHFSCEFLGMLGFLKRVFNTWGAQGCQIFDPWDAQNLLIPSKVPSRWNDWCKTIYDRAHDFVH